MKNQDDNLYVWFIALLMGTLLLGAVYATIKIRQRTQARLLLPMPVKTLSF